MQVMDDPGVDTFIIRDSDSRLTPRDAAAVSDWLKQGANYIFHCIRDHPSHSNFPISGGLWGARRTAFVQLFGGRYLLCTHFNSAGAIGAIPELLQVGVDRGEGEQWIQYM